MYNIFVGVITTDPDVGPFKLEGALGGLYDKDKELFQVKDRDGDIYYFPRENVAYFYMEQIRKAEIVPMNKEENENDLGK